MRSLLKMITPKSIHAIWCMLLLYCIIALGKAATSMYLLIATGPTFFTFIQVSTCCFGFFLEMCLFMVKCTILFTFKPDRLIRILNNRVDNNAN